MHHLFVRRCFQKTWMASPFVYMPHQMHQSIKSGSCNRNVNSKPPNVLLFCPGHSGIVTQNAMGRLDNCLRRDKYILYQISLENFAKEPWENNAKAIVIFGTDKVLNDSTVSKMISDKLCLFWKNGGKIISFNHQLSTHTSACVKTISSNVNCNKIHAITYETDGVTVKVDTDLDEVNVFNNKISSSLINIEINSSHFTVAARLKSSNASHLTDGWEGVFCLVPIFQSDASCNLSLDNQASDSILKYLLQSVGLSCSELENRNARRLISDEVSPYLGYLFSMSKARQEEFLKCFPENRFDVNIKLVPAEEFNIDDCKGLNDGKRMVALFTRGSNRPLHSDVTCKFDWDCYQNNLTSKLLGQVLIYADIMATTMNVFDCICTKFPSSVGFLAVAKQQTQGKGRGGNKWLSPLGCAMFTLALKIPLDSNLGRSLPFLQHLTATAVIHAIRTVPQLEDVDLRLKWPNDIYFGRGAKLGGVLVKSTIFADACIASIGVGVNIANQEPTVCVNTILRDECGIDRELQCEEVIARTMNKLDELIQLFQAAGASAVLPLYYKYWMHQDARVQFRDDGGDEATTGVVVGVDACGYLRVRRHDNHDRVVTLHPDGNRFDIMTSLICSRTT